MRKSYVFAGLGLMAVQFACGDDGTNKETPTSATLCVHLCARLHEAKCAGDANTDCQATCLTELAAPALCSSLAEAFATCAGKNVFTCDSKNEASPPAACSQQFTAWQTCGAQATVDASTASPSPTLDGGTTPVPTGSGDSAVIHEPLGGDAGVVINPGHVFGDAGALDGDASTSAADDAGNVPQICRPALNDDACDVCGETNCCAEYTACDADCRALGICVSDCAGNNSCLQACGSMATNAAVAQYSAILDCYDAKCAVPCGG